MLANSFFLPYPYLDLSDTRISIFPPPSVCTAHLPVPSHSCTLTLTRAQVPLPARPAHSAADREEVREWVVDQAISNEANTQVCTKGVVDEAMNGAVCTA